MPAALCLNYMQKKLFRQKYLAKKDKPVSRQIV